MHGERIRLQPSKPVNEQGFILIVTMLVLVVLTILCIGALDNSTFEVQIAANDRQSRVAFNLADGGAYVAGNLIGEAMDHTENVAHDNLSYVNIDPNDPTAISSDQTTLPSGDADAFNSRVMGYADPRDDDKFDFRLRDPNGQGDIYGRITYHESKKLAGQSADYGNAAGGAGAGSLGSTAIVTDLDIDAYSARNTRSTLAVRYRKILGAVGP